MQSPDPRTANLLGAYAGHAAARVQAAIREASGLAPSHATAVVILQNMGGAPTVQALGDVLGLSQPGAVRVVDRLVAAGLARRARSDADGRQVGVALTAAGRRTARRVVAARDAALAGDLRALGAGERAALAGLLERLLGAATTDRRTSWTICALCDPGVCGHPERCPVTQAAGG